ncbi:MAG: SRPBCC family protein [Kutzneria sp.]|nr:SRPBCC family protein [Kutzneria sp.]MBV9845449.1 SRPBCC family protein [Kutzneria sp.]
MVDFEYTETFDYPAAMVFTLLTDLPARRSWMDGILEQQITPEGPARLGTKYYEHGKFSGYESKKSSTVTEFEQDRLFTLTTVPGSPQEYRDSYRIEPISDSSCKVHFITYIDVPKVASLFMRQSMKKSVPESAKRIKAALATRAQR